MSTDGIYTPVTVFDLETTGIDPASDRIVTAYIGALDGAGELIAGREWLVRPDGYVIPEAATRVHRITQHHAEEHGRPMLDVLMEICQALAFTQPIVGHNLSYDITMLAHELQRAGHPDPIGFLSSLNFLDTFVLDKKLDRYRKGKRTLISLAELYEVALSDEDAHGAAADAIAAGRIAQHMLAGALASEDLSTLGQKQAAWYREQSESFIEYKRRSDPSFTTSVQWPIGESALALARA